MKKWLAALLMLLLALPLAAQADTFNANYAVAYMDARFECGCTRGGSGTMISRYGLVTAAHNLYCYQHSQPVKSCNFYFGAKSAGSCWYEYSGGFRYRVYETFPNGYSDENDIGYVIFETPVGNETGWFAWRVADDQYLNEEYTHVLSYNGSRHMDSIFDVQYVLNSKQVYWNGWISGTEGGPVYFWYEGMEYPEVIAVYTCHDNSGNGYGRRLTQDIYKDMKADGAFD